MKYLNKIIFIHSANIPYEEIKVDGNAHLTGTQGVGKSTILRALLFFYNADKHKLGIHQGQKSFDDFYFRYSNSYVLYEVMRENGPYTILVSRYQGRASWRFIDAPYQREWFVGDTGDVLSDWVKIRERIPKEIAMSPRIDSGVEYRDILFGNTRDNKNARYALVQSSQYQNIPRSIQNVFLNTKLDAEFIRNTIIQSMDEEESSVDIQAYRSLITTFEKEYEEIACWYRKAKDGTYPVRQLADKITEQGRMIIALNQEMRKHWRMLNFAVADNENQIPVLEQKVATIKADLEKERKRKQELVLEHQKENNELNQAKGEYKGKLKDITEKRKEFEALDIKRVLALAEKEPVYQQEYNKIQDLLNDLLKTHNSIEEKYKIAKEKLNNAYQAFTNTQEKAYIQKQESLQVNRSRVDNERSKGRSNLQRAYDEWLVLSDERWQTLIEKKTKLENACKELRTWHPKSDEIRELQLSIKQLESAQKENASQQEILKSKQAQITAEYEMNDAVLQQTAKQQEEKCLEQRAQCHQQIEKIDGLLVGLEDSLYHWLNENKKDWEETIGKVIDNERVLYAKGLEPKLDVTANNLFGVQLNLDNIDSVHRTPDEYRDEKKALEQRVLQINKELENIPIALEEEQAKLKKKYAALLNPLRQELSQLRVEEEQFPTTLQKIKSQMHHLQIEQDDMINSERVKREDAFNQAVVQLENERDARKVRKEKLEKELKDLERSFAKEIKLLDQELSDFKAKQQIEKEQKGQQFISEIKQLEAQQDAELAGKGVDVVLIDTYRIDLEKLAQTLKTIKSEYHLVIKYYDAVENLFNHEPAVRQKIKDIELRIQSLQERYQEKMARIEQKCAKWDEQYHALNQDIQHRQDGLVMYRRMVENENIVPESYISDVEKIKTPMDCQQLIINYRGADNKKRTYFQNLKHSVTQFNSNFKPDNTFQFNTTPITDVDYIQIATHLQEFMDNNKFDFYRKRVSERYTTIMSRVSYEVNRLLQRKSEVNGVINDINRDFIEKNFTGVIKSIELRMIESSDKLMQLLVSMHNFSTENEYSMGEANLFSGENRDEVNLKIVDYLKSLSRQLQSEPNRKIVSLGDTFGLQFRVKENDNETPWTERIDRVGSDGTDVLVKAMVNIMLINVFKKKAAKKNGDFILHCMMDEIGRLHPSNIKGILQFANSRNIYLINSSPMPYNPYDYKYTYRLKKEGVKTVVDTVLKRIN